jgi:hypothetical protein
MCPTFGSLASPPASRGGRERDEMLPEVSFRPKMKRADLAVGVQSLRHHLPQRGGLASHET